MKLPSRFYAIVDPGAGHEPVELANLLLQAGARILQLRLKETSGHDFLDAANRIGRLCRERGTIFIVNDRADIAMLADADGVHLGQRDIPLDAGRRVVGPDKVIGISTASVEMARAAEAGGADYIGFGPMYQGGLKNIKVAQGLEKLRAVRAAVNIPIVAIGGITEATMPAVLAAGADAAAIITDVIKAPDIAAKVRTLLAIK
ncbi:MAG TPA: thiamine phosphate synthase [Candidatus Binataceae bacterium]